MSEKKPGKPAPVDAEVMDTVNAVVAEGMKWAAVAADAAMKTIEEAAPGLEAAARRAFEPVQSASKAAGAAAGATANAVDEGAKSILGQLPEGSPIRKDPFIQFVAKAATVSALALVAGSIVIRTRSPLDKAGKAAAVGALVDAMRDVAFDGAKAWVKGGPLGRLSGGPRLEP